jgi:hypothetical protein
MVQSPEDRRSADQPSLKASFARKIEKRDRDQDRQDAGTWDSRHRKYHADGEDDDTEQVLENDASPAEDRMAINPKLSRMIISKVLRWKPNQHKADARRCREG